MTPREALLDAIAADLSRFGEYGSGLDPEALADAMLARSVEDPDLQNFRGLLEIGSPDYELPTEFESIEDARHAKLLGEARDKILSGYTGPAWQPSDVSALGRDPEQNELSPGGRYLDGLKNRAALYDAFLSEAKPEPSVAAWLGSDGPTPEEVRQARIDGQAQLYESQRGRTHGGMWWDHSGNPNLEGLSNPDTTIGSYVTQMGPVISDAFGQANTEAVNNGSWKPYTGTNPAMGFLNGLTRGPLYVKDVLGNLVSDGVGDASVRAGGADWNSNSPVLTEEMGGMDAHKLTNQMRDSYANSESMTSGDTLRAATGQKPTYANLPLRGAMSMGNGMLDGSVVKPVGASGLKNLASGMIKRGGALGQSVGHHIIKSADNMGGMTARTLAEAGEDGFMDGGLNTALSGVKPETDEEFQARIPQDTQLRDRSIKQLENNNHKIQHPGWARSAGGFLSGLIY